MLTAFDNFLEAFFTALAKDDFYQGESLLAYLDRPEDERTGDEANIVDDKIARELIEALGYRTSERQYNQPHSGAKRTDFTVVISDYPRPCFVVESKNTATRRLADHLPQLEGYMRSKGAPRGILLDGKRLLAYELANPAPVTSSDISLFNVVQAWRGEAVTAGGETGKDALSDDEKIKLRAFWARFNRDTYAASSTLVSDLIRTRHGQPHALDGSTWPSESRIPIRSAGDAGYLEGLIADTRELIRDIQLDVEAQLALRLEEYQDYQSQLDRLPDDDEPATEVFTSALNALLSELSKAGFGAAARGGIQFRLESQLERYTERDLLKGVGGDILKHLNHLNRLQAEPVYDDGSEAQPFEFAEQTSETPLLEAPKVKRSTVREVRELPSGLESALKRLQHFLGDYHEHRDALLARYAPALGVQTAFQQWRDKVATLLLRTDDEVRLRREFAAQTAYVMVVRMLLVRVAEDKELLERVFTNGGLSLWFDEVEPRYLKYAQGKSTDYLLELAYASAQHIYAHFYAERFLFDWYKPDRNMVIRVLHRLAAYDFSQIDNDVIGHIYGGYVEDEHKHESGMYYTPPEVVEYILDGIGYQGVGIIGKKLLDPASGSGAFLVSAARRLVQAYRDYYKSEGYGDVPPDAVQGVLDEVKASIYGLDLNPFACYLAETNLLIQVLDLIKRALDAGVSVALDRFNIYNTDTLRYTPKALGAINKTLPADELLIEEQIKAKVGAFEGGFDFLVANPPYVRADEGGEGLLRYRHEVKNEHPIAEVRDILKMKWDLFVPFVALGWYLLKDGGRMGMITSNAIEAVPYAASLRASLVEKASIQEVSFFPGVKLFADAVVKNTIFLVDRERADAGHEVLRRWHDNKPPAVVREETLLQTVTGAEVFRQAVDVLNKESTLPLEEICYVSVGMVLNSNEKEYKGLFKKEDLISASKDASHPVAYVEGKDIDPYELSEMNYIEYGPGLRAPDMIRRPTFPELYDHPKLIAQRSVSSGHDYVSQAVFDEGDWDGFLRTNESGVVVVPWHSLEGVENLSVGKADNGDRKVKEAVSCRFDIGYLAGVVNSRSVSDYLRTTRRHAIHIFPDDFKRVPIPDVDDAEQKAIADKAKELHKLGLCFSKLRQRGWKIDTGKRRVEGVAVLPTGVSGLPLSSVKVAWGVSVHDAGADVTSLSRSGRTLMRGKSVVLEFPATVSERAVAWLRRQFAELEAGTSFRTVEDRGFMVAASPADAEKALDELDGLEAEVREKVAAFHKLREEVDALVAALYEGDS